MPKIETFDFIANGTPEDVAGRLRAQSRRRPFPFQASPLGGKKPLGGWVSASSFRLALDPRDFLQRAQAVAIGRLEDRGDGSTRVVGQAGLPSWTTWSYRLSFLLILLLGLGLTGAGLTGAVPVEAALWSAPIFLVFGTILGALSLGFHVAHADSQVRELTHQLQQIAGAGEAPLSGLAAETAPTITDENREIEAELALRRARARQQLQ